jgi:hypothetical protein
MISMSGAEVMDVGRDALWLTIQLCTPVLLVGLVVGVSIGLFQAADPDPGTDPDLRAQDHRHLRQPDAVPAADGRAAGWFHADDRGAHRRHVIAMGRPREGD